MSRLIEALQQNVWSSVRMHESAPTAARDLRRALLHRFGSALGGAEAGLSDLATVDGVSKRVAQTMYDHFHNQG